MTNSSTVDPREVEYYTKLAQTWWDRSGPFWPLHKLNELRIEWIVSELARHGFGAAERPLEGLRVLDIGCGGGILSESLAVRGAEVHGVDVVEKNIQIARSHAEESGSGVRYEQADAQELAASGAHYDVVFNMEVVEHVADFPAFMASCCELVRPGGAMFVSTINRNPLAGLVAIFGAEYVLGWLPRGTHRYSMLRKPQEVERALAAAGLETLSKTGVRVNPFNRRFSLQSSTAVNYMLLARRTS